MDNSLKNTDQNELAEVGLPAPDFTLTDEDGEEWRLSEQLGTVTALLFYPKSETLVCTKQMCSVRDRWSDYMETRAVVVGISPGTPEEHQQFASHHQLPMPLLADPDRRITRLYSSRWWMPISFTRAIVVIDARGLVRSQRIMLRAFRPTDFRVLADIYAAKTDAMMETYSERSKARREREKG